MDQTIKVKEGELFPEGCQVLTAQGETVPIHWRDFQRFTVGKICRRVPPPPETPVKQSSTASAEQSTSGSAYFVLDLYVTGSDTPFRIDSVSTNLRKFLGAEAGYSGEINLVAVVRRLAENAPQAPDSSVRALLERGKSAVPTYPDLDAFRTADSQFPPGQPLHQPQAPSPPGWEENAPAEPGSLGDAIQALILSGVYLAGMGLLAMAARIRFLGGGGDDIMLWILSATLLSLAGISTIKARHGMRGFLRTRIPLLRAWLLCAALGAALIGFSGAAIAYVTVGGLGESVRASRGLVYVFVGGLVSAVVGIGMGMNLLFLAMAREEEILDAPTLLDYLGIE